jgi:hypothetical protein
MGVLDSILQTGRETGWEIDGTSGATVSVGTPEIKFSLNASYLRMPLKHTASGRTTLFQGGGAGIGVGVGIEIPFVNASGGPDAMPSVGSRLIRGPAFDPRGGASTFNGPCLFVTGSALATGTSQDVSVVFLLRELPWYVQMVGRALPGFEAASVLPRTKAIGICWGLSLATSLGGIGANAIMYQIIAT